MRYINLLLTYLLTR